MPKILKITQFGSTALNDGSATKCMKVADSGPTIRDSYYLTVNGEYFDADGNSASTRVPGRISATIRVYGTGSASFDANSSSVLNLVGLTGTLTGTDAGGSSLTCTARCTAVPYVHDRAAHSKYWQDLTLEFRQRTNFA